jgi:hypothetical protein
MQYSTAADVHKFKFEIHKKQWDKLPLFLSVIRCKPNQSKLFFFFFFKAKPPSISNFSLELPKGWQGTSSVPLHWKFWGQGHGVLSALNLFAGCFWVSTMTLRGSIVHLSKGAGDRAAETHYHRLLNLSNSQSKGGEVQKDFFRTVRANHKHLPKELLNREGKLPGSFSTAKLVQI